MRTRLLCRLLAVVFVVFSALAVHAQIVYPTDTSAVVTIQTVDKNIFVGKIIEADSAAVVLKTEGGETYTLRKKSIRNLWSGRSRTARLYQIPVPDSNIHASRYFVGPSAYGLRRGQWYYENSMLVLNQITYGFSDHFSLGAGFALLPMLEGSMPLWVTPKISLPIVRNKVNFSLGAMYGREFLTEESGRQTFGAMYAQSTFGSPQYNISAGVGFSYTDDKWSSHPVLSLSGCLRTSKMFYLISENYRFQTEYESTTLLSLGGRFMFWQVAIDAIFLAPILSDGQFVPLPWVGFHLLFGKMNR